MIDRNITGSDGLTSWSVPPAGRIRVSNDLERFRGGLPGNQHSIPLINIHEDLASIRAAYDVRWPDSESVTANAEQNCLIAEKKSSEHRGPKYVEIWFDPETGTITEMLLDKLPQARGGPRSVLLELTDQSVMPDDFFQHTSHHGSARKVVNE